MSSYHVVVSFRVLSRTKFALESLSVSKFRDFVSLHVFFQVALLYESLAAITSNVWLSVRVSVGVIKEVPSSYELSISIIKFANVDSHLLLYSLYVFVFSVVWKI